MNRDYIERVAPEHDKTSCSDANPCNARYKDDDFAGCYRCTLLKAAGWLGGKPLPDAPGVLASDAMKQAEDMRNATLRAVFLDLLGQVDKFIAEQGEADFYTGPARAMQAILHGRPPADHLRDGLERLMHEHGIGGVGEVGRG
jgi:hypothetical protein